MRTHLLFLLVIFVHTLSAQNKILTHDDFDRWNRISNSAISPNGDFILYEVEPGKGDGELYVHEKDGDLVFKAERGANGQITWDSRYVVFKIKPQHDLVLDLRRKKTKDADLPKDSLGIYDLKEKSLLKIPGVRSFNLPEKSAGMLTYMLEEIKPAEGDTTKKASKAKKVGKDNGYHLVMRKLETGNQDTVKYVKSHALAKRANDFIYHTSGVDSTIMEGVYHYSFTSGERQPLTRAKGDYTQLALSEDGVQAAFLADLDTTKALIRNYQLRHYDAEVDSAVVVAQRGTSGIPEEWLVNKNGNVYFSKSGQRLFFGSSPEPAVQDTTLLPEEIIKVEVWNYQNGRLHTQQNVELENDKKASYLAYYHTSDKKLVQLANENVPNVSVPDHGDGFYAMGESNIPYEKYISWEGYPQRQDVYKIDVTTGEATLVIEDLRGYAGISAEGDFFHFYNAEDTTWYSFENGTDELRALTKNIPVSMADEEDDHPNYPAPYGAAGWTTDDKALLVYDRFDIWKLDPRNQAAPVKLTNGRASQITYRNMDLDREEAAIDTKVMVLHTFSETTKNEGYALMKNLGSPKQMIEKAAAFSRVNKAEEGETLTYTMSNHELFPNISTTDLKLKKFTQISDVNPQQDDYAWGTVELVKWTSLDGLELSGKLYKPANFDPNKKYPMIVNFYETHSDDLHRHWGVRPHRSTINAAFYSNRGYLVFNPDVKYKIGYPGESALNCVVSGTTHLINQGFVDKDRIGVQGHSWGGYQIAYLVTKTDIFACAEAGAVVANMISAYGGIRWGSGLSRMFQYEHSQSRIGGTLWEYPIRYIENSPIFFADKVNTPLLMMHNDNDGAVPWYQGIEYYTALRRLNKPVWMLNYNGEPHWPTKWENIRDFNIRMNQFFDYYLKGAPIPEWMDKGVPAVEKGINPGLELIPSDHEE